MLVPGNRCHLMRRYRNDYIHPKGICTKKIEFEVENGTIKNVKFAGGCMGDLNIISKLTEGMRVDEVIQKIQRKSLS